MKRILVLGAGQSSPFLIRYLLERAAERDWLVAVGDLDADLAAQRVAGAERGEAIAVDVTREARLAATVAGADLVVNLMPPALQDLIARHCLRAGRHMVSVAYATPVMRQLAGEAADRGTLLLAEIGLDPGIDHMASMALVDRLRREGGVVESFESYGSGVPAPDSVDNPLAYAVTWSARGVVEAGAGGALYLRDGRLEAVPAARVFERTWPVEVEGVGGMEAYANRDSLAYRELFGLAEAGTLIRGTLRYPGWCEVWRQVVRLGLPGATFAIPRLAESSFAELVEAFLPAGTGGDGVEARAARFLGLDPAGPVMDKLRWLGLFSAEPTGCRGATAADALVELLSAKLTLPPGGRDMVVLLHDLVVRYPSGHREGTGARRERITSTLIELGEPGGDTAMARTVGLPAAVAARLILEGELELTGSHIPTEPAVYRPVLAELAREGISFRERVRPVSAAAAARPEAAT